MHGRVYLPAESNARAMVRRASHLTAEKYPCARCPQSGVQPIQRFDPERDVAGNICFCFFLFPARQGPPCANFFALESY